MTLLSPAPGVQMDFLAKMVQPLFKLLDQQPASAIAKQIMWALTVRIINVLWELMVRHVKMAGLLRLLMGISVIVGVHLDIMVLIAS